MPVRLCALLAEELRASRVGELRPVRDAALEVAADHPARRLRQFRGRNLADRRPGCGDAARVTWFRAAPAAFG